MNYIGILVSMTHHIPAECRDPNCVEGDRWFVAIKAVDQLLRPIPDTQTEIFDFATENEAQVFAAGLNAGTAYMTRARGGIVSDNVLKRTEHPS